MIQIKKRWTFTRESMNLYSHAKRPKSCKMGSRYLPLSTKREATPRGNLSKIPSEQKEEARDPDPDVEARQDLGNIMGNYIFTESCCSHNKTLSSKGRFPIPLNYIDVQRQTKTSMDVLHETTFDDYWNIGGDKSHCQNLWQASSHSTKACYLPFLSLFLFSELPLQVCPLLGFSL